MLEWVSPSRKQSLAKRIEVRQKSDKSEELAGVIPLQINAQQSRLLEGIAEQRQGRLFTPADVEQVLDLLAQKVQPRESRQDSKPWQDQPMVWWLLGALVGLLTLEWLWRKGLDLP